MLIHKIKINYKNKTHFNNTICGNGHVLDQKK